MTHVCSNGLWDIYLHNIQWFAAYLEQRYKKERAKSLAENKPLSHKYSISLLQVYPSTMFNSLFNWLIPSELKSTVFATIVCLAYRSFPTERCEGILIRCKWDSVEMLHPLGGQPHIECILDSDHFAIQLALAAQLSCVGALHWIKSTLTIINVLLTE